MIIRETFQFLARLFDQLLGTRKVPRETQKVLLYLFCVVILSQILLITHTALLLMTLQVVSALRQ